MKITPYDNTFTLDGVSIDSFSEQLDKTLQEMDMERANRMRIRLSFEEALLRMRDHYGQDQQVHAHIYKHLMRLTIQVDLKGDAYNPLTEEESALEDLCGSLLTAVGLTPQYQYDRNINFLRVQISLPGINPVIRILAAVAGGILIGFAGNALMHSHVKEIVCTHVMEPIYELWYRTINAMSGPVIFLSVITAVLNSEKLSERGGSSKRVVGRYFIFSFIMAALALWAALLAFPLTFAGNAAVADESADFFKELLLFVPEDAFTPFIMSNTPQLLFLAFMIGGALNALGDQTKNLRRVIRQANSIGLLIAEWISRLVPYAVFFLLGYKIWQGKTEILSGLINCFLIALGVSAFCMLLALCGVRIKEKVPIRTLLAKLKEPFWLTIKSGSLDAAYGKTERSCISELGLNRGYTAISLPNGLVLYMPVSAIGTVVFIVFAAMKYNVATSPVWYATLVILSVCLFVATPPVPGANLLAYIAIVKLLGIPGEILIDAMIFDIIFGIFANAGNQLLLQLELILQADRFGFLDRQTLHE